MILFLTLVVTLIVVKDSVAVETPVLVEFCSNGGNKSEQRWFGCKESCPDDWQTLKQDPKG